MAEREDAWLESAARINSAAILRERIGEEPPSNPNARVLEERLRAEVFTRNGYDWDRIPADDAAVEAALDALFSQVRSHGT